MKTTYSSKLKNPLWQRRRLEILSRDNFTCQLCSDTSIELHVHHKEYIKGKEPWEYEDDNFQTLCKYCHNTVEYCNRISTASKFDNKIISILKTESANFYFLFAKTEENRLIIFYYSKSDDLVEAQAALLENELDTVYQFFKTN